MKIISKRSWHTFAKMQNMAPAVQILIGMQIQMKYLRIL